MTKSQYELVAQQIEWQVQKQLSPKQIFFSIVDYCWEHKIELPSYYSLTNILTSTYNTFEKNLLGSLEKNITSMKRPSQWIRQEIER